MALVPCNPLKGDLCEFKHLGLLLVRIFDWLLGLAALVAMLFIVWGGIQMLKGWLEEEPEGAFKAGLQTVRRAIWGLILVAAAFLIVNTLLLDVLKTEGLNELFLVPFREP